VPYTVCKQVPCQVKKCVTVCVPRQVCEQVEVCVPRVVHKKVPYTVCRWVCSDPCNHGCN
jgi:hypothetical protein